MTYSLKDSILSLVKTQNINKPTRYLGGEINAVIKNDASFKFVMAFADLYEIGISNLGLSILYEAINEMDYASCERVYAVEKDFESILIENNIPLYTLETFSRVKDADVLGFTLQYELIYTNILQILDLSGIPILREERKEDDPIIVAGGPNVYNPFPLENFVDVFLMGEFDFEIKNFVDIIYKLKQKKVSRENIIKALSSLEYAYAPKYKKERVKKIFVDSLDDTPYPKRPLVPLLEGAQNRLSVEIARGCTHGCRFCLAGITYRPVRNRSLDRILDIVDESLSSCGANEINLFSLSADDYPYIKELIDYLQTLGEYKGFSLSLPSLRIDSFDKESAKRIAQFKKTGLTFALEVGSTELRKKINKSMDEDAIFNIVSDIKEMGWKTVKIYFMIGFTEDPDKEALDIIDVLEKLSNIAGNKIKINASINVFIPKPHTPLENINQLTEGEAIILIEKIKDVFRRTNVNIKFHSPKMAEIEGIISRGDKAVSDIIYLAYKKGARLDAWNEHFDYAIWKEAIEECGFSIKDLLSKRNYMPWKCVDVLVKDEFLKREYKKFEDAEFSDYCFLGNCQNCGIDYKNYCYKYKNELKESKDKYEFPKLDNEKKTDVYKTETKIFIHYKKVGISSLLGMHDITRVICSALKICGAKITLTQGFHPLNKIVFTDPTPFGCDSEKEYAEVCLTNDIDVIFLKNKMNELLNHIGLTIVSIDKIVPNIKKIAMLPKNIVYRLYTSDDKKSSILLSDKEKLKEYVKRDGDYLVVFDGNGVLLTIKHSEGKSVRIRDIKDYLMTFTINIVNIQKIDIV